MLVRVLQLGDRREISIIILQARRDASRLPEQEMKKWAPSSYALRCYDDTTTPKVMMVGSALRALGKGANAAPYSHFLGPRPR